MRHESTRTSGIVKSLAAKFGPFKVSSRRHYAPVDQLRLIYMDLPNGFESDCTSILRQLCPEPPVGSTPPSTVVIEAYVLPAELLMIVFDFCSPKTLSSVTKVSAYMKSLVESSRQMERIRKRRLTQPQSDVTWNDYHKARVYKTTALAMGVKVADLQALPCDLVPNPNYRSGPPSHLYSLIEIDEILFEIPEAVHASRQRLLKEDKELAEAEKRARDVRSSELKAALRARGIPVRVDSKVCDDFIWGKKSALATAELVADVMEDMYFFVNTLTMWRGCALKCGRLSAMRIGWMPVRWRD
jgi:hypothetical protein